MRHCNGRQVCADRVFFTSVSGSEEAHKAIGGFGYRLGRSCNSNTRPTTAGNIVLRRTGQQGKNRLGNVWVAACLRVPYCRLKHLLSCASFGG